MESARLLPRPAAPPSLRRRAPVRGWQRAPAPLVSAMRPRWSHRGEDAGGGLQKPGGADGSAIGLMPAPTGTPRHRRRIAPAGPASAAVRDAEPESRIKTYVIRFSRSKYDKQPEAPGPNGSARTGTFVASAG